MSSRVLVTVVILHFQDVPYSLEKDYTGHAVIVDNENTEGTQADVAALRQAYEAAGFEVQVHRECSGQVGIH